VITEIDMRNFRCFRHLKVENCERFNLIVGDNGGGKTALLEAIFLTLAGNVEVSMRLKAHRGFDTAFSGPPRAIEEAIWRDYFYNLDWNNPINVNLTGSGPEARSLTISKGTADALIPFSGFDQKESSGSSAITFTWRDSAGRTHTSSPKIAPQGIQIPVSAEDLPDFFLYPANQLTLASETAARFSELSRERREREFVEVFSREYPWIHDLNIEVYGGFPVIHATLKDSKVKLPINAVSGGINRVIAIMLSLAARPGSVVLVDEIEDGIFYKHKTTLWRALLVLARKHGCQMFLTTHDEEWLEALVDASEENVDDIALWRFSRDSDGNHILRQFSAQTFKAGIETGGEVR